MEPCAELTLDELEQLEERVEAGTASTAERELHASAKAAVRPFAKTLEHAARSRVDRVRAARPRVHMHAPAARPRERRATRRAQARSLGGGDPSEPPLAEIPVSAFRAEVARMLGDEAA